MSTDFGHFAVFFLCVNARDYFFQEHMLEKLNSQNQISIYTPPFNFNLIFLFFSISTKKYYYFWLIFNTPPPQSMFHQIQKK